MKPWLVQAHDAEPVMRLRAGKPDSRTRGDLMEVLYANDAQITMPCFAWAGARKSAPARSGSQHLAVRGCSAAYRMPPVSMAADGTCAAEASCQSCKGVLASRRNFPSLVMAGLVPAIPITGHCASMIEITGASPVMTYSQFRT
ncbi:MAG: hypothetical protein BGN84_06160 [Afipia sp. 62-7]|nr:MAG: hypothetical protein BGN84_06160 [Afipia sp. 62-7]